MSWSWVARPVFWRVKFVVVIILFILLELYFASNTLRFQDSNMLWEIVIHHHSTTNNEKHDVGSLGMWRSDTYSFERHIAALLGSGKFSCLWRSVYTTQPTTNNGEHGVFSLAIVIVLILFVEVFSNG